MTKAQRRAAQAVRMAARWTRRHLKFWIAVAAPADTAVITLLTELISRPGQSLQAVNGLIAVSGVPIALSIALPAAGYFVEERDKAARQTKEHAHAASAATEETASDELPVHAADALELGVHPAPSVSDDPETGVPALLAYLLRHHDDLLRRQLRSAASGGPGSFALLVGGSTSGKTRALYEALRATVPGWLVLWPRDADDLVDLLLNGRFTAGAVLWLNETQRYLEGAAGARAAAHLSRLLAVTPGAVVVGAMWRKPYLEELTARGTPGDPNAAARELLESPRTHLISVPDHLDLTQQEELAELAARSGDKRLLAALDACGPDGHVFQHVTGGPELVEAYQAGGLFTPVERALITAALDARRFGHRAPIPDRLLQAAADGYLKPHERRGEPDWAATALNAITSGERADGTRTSIRKALTALRTSRSRSGQPAAEYEPDDYLDQHTRQSRQASIGSPEIWDALADHATDTDDMHRLGEAWSLGAPVRPRRERGGRSGKRAGGAGRPRDACGYSREQRRLR